MVFSAFHSKMKGILESCRVPIVPPEKIGAMIGYFKDVMEHPPQKIDDLKQLAAAELCHDLLRFVLGQPQDTWSDADFGLTEKPEAE